MSSLPSFKNSQFNQVQDLMLTRRCGNDVDLLLAAWLTITGVFLGLPTIYYSYLWFAASRSWDVKINAKYSPPVTIIIPTHNEEKTVRLKLMNVSRVFYPKEKMQIIVADDASTDRTIEEVSRFAKENPGVNIEIMGETHQMGKSAILNHALQQAKHNIIVVSDADTFWARDILIEALPFLADTSIGAVSGRQELLKADSSLLTRTEKTYLDLTYNVIKLGESKINSTILFHGLFGAYRRSSLGKFNVETDDSGTALDIVQKGTRTIYVPTAICYEIPYMTWKGKISTKVRRGSQLIQIYWKCLRLLLKKQLVLPRRIAVPQILLYTINPLLFIVLISLWIVLISRFSPYSIVFAILPLFIAIPKLRPIIIEALQDNLILLWALIYSISRRKFISWQPQEESRSALTEEMLKRKGLI